MVLPSETDRTWYYRWIWIGYIDLELQTPNSGLEEMGYRIQIAGIYLCFVVWPSETARAWYYRWIWIGYIDFELQTPNSSLVAMIWHEIWVIYFGKVDRPIGIFLTFTIQYLMTMQVTNQNNAISCRMNNRHGGLLLLRWSVTFMIKHTSPAASAGLFFCVSVRWHSFHFRKGRPRYVNHVNRVWNRMNN